MEIQSRQNPGRDQKYRTSWSRFIQLGCPSRPYWVRLTQELNKVLSVLRDGEQWRSDEKERVYLSDEVYSAAVRKLTFVDLSLDRYRRWCEFGKVGCDGYISITLREIGLDEERIGRLVDGLLAIEPLSSKKPIDQFQIVEVLENVGDVWSAFRKADHESSS